MEMSRTFTKLLYFQMDIIYVFLLLLQPFQYNTNKDYVHEKFNKA